MSEKNKLPVIGVFALSNTGGICVHEMNYGDDRVLASMNGENPEWLDIIEKPLSEVTGEDKDDDEWESGFMWGSFFVPFSEMERV